MRYDIWGQEERAERLKKEKKAETEDTTLRERAQSGKAFAGDVKRPKKHPQAVIEHRCQKRVRTHRMKIPVISGQDREAIRPSWVRVRPRALADDVRVSLFEVPLANAACQSHQTYICTKISNSAFSAQPLNDLVETSQKMELRTLS